MKTLVGPRPFLRKRRTRGPVRDRDPATGLNSEAFAPAGSVLDRASVRALRRATHAKPAPRAGAHGDEFIAERQRSSCRGEWHVDRPRVRVRPHRQRALRESRAALSLPGLRCLTSHLRPQLESRATTLTPPSQSGKIAWRRRALEPSGSASGHLQCKQPKDPCTENADH